MIFPPEPSKECAKVSHVIFECRVINHHPNSITIRVKFELKIVKLALFERVKIKIPIFWQSKVLRDAVGTYGPRAINGHNLARSKLIFDSY